MARIWAGGLGGQCNKRPRAADEVFCRYHLKGEKWQVHGRVDGPVPAKKLFEFEKKKARARVSTFAAAVAGPPIGATGTADLTQPGVGRREALARVAPLAAVAPSPSAGAVGTAGLTQPQVEEEKAWARNP